MKLYLKIKNKIKGHSAKPVVVPNYEEKKTILESYKKKYGLNILVETGTFMGDTVDYFKNNFKKIISIELAEELAVKAQKRFKDYSNINIIKGDSGEVLKDLIKELDEPVLFWLDGHYSSEFFIGNEYIRTAKGNLNTPIEKELKTIFTSRQNHVILIDDARLFNGLNDYPTINKVKKLIKNSGMHYDISVHNDIICITPQ